MVQVFPIIEALVGVKDFPVTVQAGVELGLEQAGLNVAGVDDILMVSPFVDNSATEGAG